MTTVGTAGAGVQPSAFLDSTVLVRLFLFWDACRTANIGLDRVAEWGDLKAILATATPAGDAVNRTDGEYLRLGLRSFRRLRERAGDYHYFSSRVCWSEVHHVLLEGRGLEQLIRQGVPYGLRVKRPQVLFRVALEENDYVQLGADLEDFREMLKLDYGLDMIDVEDSSAGFGITPDSVWDVAQAVWSRLLMEVIDAYLFAAAISIKADFFITGDGSLRDALRRLSDPQGAWEPMAVSLKKAIGMDPGALLPCPLTPSDPLTNNLA